MLNNCFMSHHLQFNTVPHPIIGTLQYPATLELHSNCNTHEKATKQRALEKHYFEVELFTWEQPLTFLWFEWSYPYFLLPALITILPSSGPHQWHGDTGSISHRTRALQSAVSQGWLLYHQMCSFCNRPLECKHIFRQHCCYLLNFRFINHEFSKYVDIFWIWWKFTLDTAWW